MLTVRSATSDDFPEIVRLALSLWNDMGLDVEAGVWTTNAKDFFRSSLSNGSLNAFVVDNPDDAARIVACGVGVISPIMANPWSPSGKMGYVQWFCTERDFRRRGLATEILRQIMEWYGENEVTRVQLHASDKAQGIYRAAGFVDTSYSNLWHRI